MSRYKVVDVRYVDKVGKDGIIRKTKVAAIAKKGDLLRGNEIVGEVELQGMSSNDPSDYSVGETTDGKPILHGAFQGPLMEPDVAAIIGHIEKKKRESLEKAVEDFSDEHEDLGPLPDEHELTKEDVEELPDKFKKYH